MIMKKICIGNITLAFWLGASTPGCSFLTDERNEESLNFDSAENTSEDSEDNNEPEEVDETDTTPEERSEPEEGDAGLSSFGGDISVEIQESIDLQGSPSQIVRLSPEGSNFLIGLEGMAVYSYGDIGQLHSETTNERTLLSNIASDHTIPATAYMSDFLAHHDNWLALGYSMDDLSGEVLIIDTEAPQAPAIRIAGDGIYTASFYDAGESANTKLLVNALALDGESNGNGLYGYDLGLALTDTFALYPSGSFSGQLSAVGRHGLWAGWFDSSNQAVFLDANEMNEMLFNEPDAVSITSSDLTLSDVQSINQLFVDATGDVYSVVLLGEYNDAWELELTRVELYFHRRNISDPSLVESVALGTLVDFMNFDCSGFVGALQIDSETMALVVNGCAEEGTTKIIPFTLIN